MTILYHPYFCEENIWQLCADGSVPEEGRQVVFITNKLRRVAIDKQRAAGGGAAVWDYHVVLVAGGQVWDPDSTLGMPVGLERWIRESFPPGESQFAPRFRVIDAAAYRSSFASDRSHMLDSRGRPLHPFPPWPQIGEGMNLPRLIDVESDFLGNVVDLDGLPGSL